MQQTDIEWTRTYAADGSFTRGYTSNPIYARRLSDGKRGHACVHASPGCQHCYSERWNGWRGTGLKFNVPALQEVEIVLNQDELRRMRRLKAGVKVFVCDMTDLFGPFVTNAYLGEVFSAMEDNTGVTWQVLTKRPERMASYLSQRWRAGAASHIWIGTSVEDQQRANERIPHLLRVPARVRFLSCEPLLGPLDLSHYLIDDWTRIGDDVHWHEHPPIHWLIVGGESGHGARPMYPQWARSLRDQAQSAGVAYFFKQWGEWLPMVCERDENMQGRWIGADGRRLYIPDLLAHAHHIAHDEGIVRLGKKAAGRLLDGVEWSQFPDTVDTTAVA